MEQEKDGNVAHGVILELRRRNFSLWKASCLSRIGTWEVFNFMLIYAL